MFILTGVECTGRNVTLELVLIVTSHLSVRCDDSPRFIHATIEQTVSLARKCRVMEVQVPWPAVRTNTLDTIDQVDIRYERLILILQLFCRKRGIKHKFTGKFLGFAHLVMEIPQAQALKLLGCEIHPCIRRAGFQDWQFPEGSPVMRVQSRLFAEWNRERELQHGSVAATKGIIRLYCGDFLGDQVFERICNSITANRLWH